MYKYYFFFLCIYSLFFSVAAETTGPAEIEFKESGSPLFDYPLIGTWGTKLKMEDEEKVKMFAYRTYTLEGKYNAPPLRVTYDHEGSLKPTSNFVFKRGIYGKFQQCVKIVNSKNPEEVLKKYKLTEAPCTWAKEDEDDSKILIIDDVEAVDRFLGSINKTTVSPSEQTTTNILSTSIAIFLTRANIFNITLNKNRLSMQRSTEEDLEDKASNKNEVYNFKKTKSVIINKINDYELFTGVLNN